MMLAIQMYLVFVSGNDMADRLSNLEDAERRRPEEKEGKDSSEEEEPFITCKDYKKIIKDVFKNLKKDKFLEGSKCEEECLGEHKYDEGPLHDYAAAGCSELDYPLDAACASEFPRLMRNGCMSEVWRGDGSFDEKDAEEEVGCGDGETYSITSYAEFESPVLGNSRAMRSVARTKRTTPPMWNLNDMEFAVLIYNCNAGSNDACFELIRGPEESHLYQAKAERAMRAKTARTRDSERDGDWREEPARISNELEILRVCSKKGGDSVECQTLLAPSKQGKAMRAKRTSGQKKWDGDWATREDYVSLVCSKKGRDSVECQKLLASYTQNYAVLFK